MIPHTIIFRQADQLKWYFTANGGGIQQKNAANITITGIRRAFAVTGTPEGPVAVWHSERKDHRGYLYTQEFFNQGGLSAFLKRKSDRGRCGVLQQFILPKDIKGKEGVNHELLVTRDALGSITVQRRFNTLLLEPSKQVGLGQQACVHPCINVVGKLTPPPSAATAPYNPSEVIVGYDGMQSSALLAVLSPAMQNITSRLCVLRHESTTDSTYSRELSCLFKVDRDNQLWLLGLSSLKSTQKAIDWLIPDFEFFKQKNPSDRGLKKSSKDSKKVEGPEQDFTFEINAYEINSPVVEQASQPLPKKVKIKQKKKGDFICPNCGITTDASEVNTTTYKSILRYINRRSKEQEKSVTQLLSSEDATDFSAPFQQPDSAALLDHTHNWVTVPPVVQRLSKGIEEIQSSKIWLARQVSICKGCYALFYNEKDELDQLRECYQREQSLLHAHTQRIGAWSSWLPQKSISSCLTSQKRHLMNEMVFTNLQEYHRTLQHKTNEKRRKRHLLQERVSPPPDYPQRINSSGDMSNSCSIPHPPVTSPKKAPGYSRIQFGPKYSPTTTANTAVQLQTFKTSKNTNTSKLRYEEDTADGTIKDCLHLLEPRGAAGTEIESTISTVLCNQLYSELASILTFGIPVEEEDVPTRHRFYSVYGNNNNRIPPPDPLIEISILPNDARRISERESASSLNKHCNKIYVCLSDVLPLFSGLTPQEKEILLRVVSNSYLREQEKQKQERIRKKKGDAAANRIEE